MNKIPISESHVRKLIDEFGYRVLLRAARGDFSERIPTRLMGACSLAGKYVEKIRRDQREFERQITEQQ